MKNTKHSIYLCSAEFRIRAQRDLNQIVPGAAWNNDEEPELIASFGDPEKAKTAFSGYDSDVRIFSDHGMCFARLREYALVNESYEVGEDGDEWPSDVISAVFSHIIDSVDFGGCEYFFAESPYSMGWVEAEEEEV